MLDLTGESGQFCGRLLAGLGAEVIKVEPPEGDSVRLLPPFAGDAPHRERSLTWWVFNAGKRSITLDLDEAAGREVFRALAGTVDLVLESARPGAMAAKGLDYRALSRLNPAIVVTSITGFGQEGPYRDYTWSDIVCMALGGLMFLLGDPDRPPVRMGPPQAYLTSNVQAATGSATALFHRTRTGEGQHVDLSIQEAVTFNLNGPGSITSWWTMHRTNVARAGDRINFGPRRPRVFVKCKDGYTANAGGILGEHFPRLLEVLEAEGAAEDLSDPKWVGASMYGALPGQWRPTLEDIDHTVAIFERWQARRTRAELFDLAVDKSLWLCPVNTPADIAADPQLQDRGFLETVRHPAYTKPVITTGAPFRYSQSPWVPGSRPPLLGEDNDAVYGDLIGLSRRDIERLRTAGVV